MQNTLIFASDNWAGAHPDIAEAVLRANDGLHPSYGNSDQDAALSARFSEIFDREVSVFLVASGTAANALSLSAMARPGDVMWCHREAHIRVDECGAPFFFGQGMQLEAVDGALGKITPDALRHAIETTKAGGLNAGRPGGLSLTQATESGTLYTPDEIASLAETLRSATGRADAPVHMDGARFANALVALDCSLAEMTWKQGVDILSFGATKNGCWCAEAIIVFRPELAAHLDYLRKRSGHLVSKMRFMNAQFEAYLQNGFWLDIAKHANAQAVRLEAAVEASQTAELAWPRQINEVFALVDSDQLSAWQQEGLVVSPWWPPHAERSRVSDGRSLIRLVTSFATTDEELTAFEALIAA